MLHRVLEPEIMDSLREAIDYDSMDHADVNRRFVGDLLAAGGLEGEVLDLGTGTALIPIELCHRAAVVRVLAVDLAESMLDVARGNVEVEGLADRIRLDRVDAKALPFEAGRFACVISNSIVHHIADPRPVLTESLRVLAPGGRLFFRDLARPDDDRTVRHLVETYAADANPHQRQMFEDSLRAALSLAEMQALVVELGCRPDSVSMTSDRHWTFNLIKPAID